MTKLKEPYFQYLVLVSLLGSLPLIWGLSEIPSFDPLLTFLLLFLLAVTAESSATSMAIAEEGGITFEVGTAVAMAAVPLFGAAAAAVIAVVTSLGIWLIRPVHRATWKRSWEQLIFNAGMHSMAIFSAGWLFLVVRSWLGAATLWGQVLPWLTAAALYDQINFWILMGIVRLQQGPSMRPLEIWRENSWAMPINIAVIAIGGAVLNYANEIFGAIGIAIFFLPVFLSAYAFRLYVRQMQKHMDNLEQIIAERTEALTNLMREKDDFLAVLTHDMKSPLTSIDLYVSMLRKRPSIINEKPHLLDTISRSQKTLVDMVNNILDLEQLKSGSEMPMDKKRIDLGTVLENSLESMSPQAKHKQIELHYEPVESQLTVNADPNQMERCFTNLISNAIKYSNQGAKVTISAQHDGQSALVMVRDTGYGIPDDELPFIFDRYHRVVQHQTIAAGTGLGLAITKAIINAHGGQIMVESVVDKGSTFTVQIPLYESGNGPKIPA